MGCHCTDECKRRYNLKLWKTFIDCFNCLPACAVIDEKIICMHGGLSPELKNLEQIKRIQRPTDVPDQGLLCDLLWADPDKEVARWGENDRGVSYTFGPESVADFLARHDLDLVCRAHQVMSSLSRFVCVSAWLCVRLGPLLMQILKVWGIYLVAGCRGWLRVLCPTTACNNFQCTELLWRIR